MIKLHVKFAAFLSIAASLAWIPSQAVTLEEAVRAALEANPDIEAAQTRIQNARGMLQQVLSGYYPWLNASAQYGRSDNPPQAFMMTLNQRNLNVMDPTFNPNEPDDTENLRASLTLQWRLFDWGRREADREMARWGIEAAREMEEATRNQLVYEVVRAYYSVLQAAAFAEVQSEAARSIEESLRIAQERYRAGSAMKTDVLNLETQLAQAREDLIRAENGRQLALAALNTVIGVPLATKENIQAPWETDEPPPIPTVAPDAVEQRPELRAARITTRMKEWALRKAQRDYGPTLSLFASSDWDTQPITDFEQSYMVGAMAELNLFDGFRKRGARATALADAKEARAAERKARDQLQLDLAQAQLRAEEAMERLEVTHKNLQSAREALRITREQYEQGAADIALLLQAQVGVTAMLTRHAAARYDYLIALANLERALGKAHRAYEKSH